MNKPLTQYIEAHKEEYHSLCEEAKATYKSHRSVTFACSSKDEKVKTYVDDRIVREASSSISAFVMGAAKYTEEIMGDSVTVGITIKIK